MNRQSLIAIIVCILIALAIGSFYYLKNRNSSTAGSDAKPVSHKFIGQVTKIEGSAIYARGYVFLDNPDKPATTTAQEVTINTSEKTRFLKTLVYRDKAVAGQVWDPSKLRREEVDSSVVGLSELIRKINGLDITVTTSEDILNDTAFNAESIRYSEEVYPE